MAVKCARDDGISRSGQWMKVYFRCLNRKPSNFHALNILGRGLTDDGRQSNPNRRSTPSTFNPMTGLSCVYTAPSLRIAGHFILGVSEPPGVWIIAGGCIILAATFITTVSQFHKEAQQRQGLGKRAHSLTDVELQSLTSAIPSQRTVEG